MFYFGCYSLLAARLGYYFVLASFVFKSYILAVTHHRSEEIIERSLLRESIDIKFQELLRSQMNQPDTDPFTHHAGLLDAVHRGLSSFHIFDDNSNMRTGLAEELTSTTFENLTSQSIYAVKSTYHLRKDSRFISLDKESDLAEIVNITANEIYYCSEQRPRIGDFFIGSASGSWTNGTSTMHWKSYGISNRGLVFARKVHLDAIQIVLLPSQKCYNVPTKPIHPLELFQTMQVSANSQLPLDYTQIPLAENDNTKWQRPIEEDSEANSKANADRSLGSFSTPDSPLLICNTPSFVQAATFVPPPNLMGSGLVYSPLYYGGLYYTVYYTLYYILYYILNYSTYNSVQYHILIAHTIDNILYYILYYIS